MSAARPVVIIGTLVFTDGDGGPSLPPTPPGIWGPTDPRPSNPIVTYPGGTPNPPGIWGPTDPRPGYWVPGAPGAPGYGTGIWGPNDPRPTNPISGIPGLPGYSPPGSEIPSHPISEPPKVDAPQGYEWKQVYSPPTPGGWTWTLVPEEGTK